MCNKQFKDNVSVPEIWKIFGHGHRTSVLDPLNQQSTVGLADPLLLIMAMVKPRPYINRISAIAPGEKNKEIEPLERLRI